MNAEWWSSNRSGEVLPDPEVRVAKERLNVLSNHRTSTGTLVQQRRDKASKYPLSY